jgi:tryptophan 2,3-dioxygenase
MMQDTIDKIVAKYQSMNQDPEIYLKGLLYAKPVNYWDYIEVDTLLSLQKTRTDFPDEEIFIIYHQITELMLKLIRNEVNQMIDAKELSSAFLIIKMERINRYTELLVNSFSIMSEGMDYDDYNQFRLTLTPASGLQSVSFRFIELCFTDITNLINEPTKKIVPDNATIEELFNYVYWQEAGFNRQTGEKSLTLTQFEDKYLQDLIVHAKEMKDKNIYARIKDMAKDESNKRLVEVLRKFDRLYNIKWPLVHLATAQTYLNKKGENKRATGGSDWQKYLHPAFQQRKFFPNLWSQEEIYNWAKEYIVE